MKTSTLLSTSAILLLTTSCASLLPSGSESVKSPWETFASAKAAYDMIIVDKTTKEELKKLGFDPYSTPNVKILTYANIIQRFMFNPSIQMEDLDKGLQRCIKAKSNCEAYEVKPEMTNTKRLGNFWLDFLNFKRNVHQTGWKFDALVVMVNDVVVYKLFGGNPTVDQNKRATNPLGPLQDSEQAIIDLMRQ